MALTDTGALYVWGAIAGATPETYSAGLPQPAKSAVESGREVWKAKTG